MKYLLLFCSLVLIGCRNEKSSYSDDLKSVSSFDNSNELENNAYAGKLVHSVYLNLNDDLDSNQLIIVQEAVATLKEIPEVKDLNIGHFEDLGDVRAMSSLELVFTMGFSKREDYNTYQKHPIHLELKKKIKDYLSGPPITYDYWAQ